METGVDPQQLRRILEVIVGERTPFSGQRQSRVLSKKSWKVTGSASKAIFFRIGEKPFVTSLAAGALNTVGR
jgi:hypothetical protein